MSGRVRSRGDRHGLGCDSCRAQLTQTCLREYDMFSAVYWFCNESCLNAYNVQVALADELEREEHVT